jgi:hypothetical protein
MKDRSAGLVVGLVTGIVTTALFNQLGHAGDWSSPAKYLEARGFLYGTLASVLGYGLTRLVLLLSRVRAAAFGMATLLCLVGLFTLWWNIMWGTPLLSLEGAWLWPLALVPLVLSFLSFKHWRRMAS